MTFKDQVIYQIYPKSFKDTSGNGIGDLEGIRQSLDYLAKLGVDMIWLNPIYPSPQKDNGYDVADYCAIDPLFGTMTEFERLVQEAEAKGIGIMLDMVFNHVSTQHPWFQKALAGDKTYQDFFILRDQPTDWQSKFGGSAWAPFGNSGRYYLHLFDQSQADLNWRNPQVREALYQVIDFWRGKGVSGFRFDVINLIGKDAVLYDEPQDDGKPAYTDKPVVHDYLQELYEKCLDASMVTVGEMSSTTIQSCLDYTNPKRKELTMAFNFHHLKVDYGAGNKWVLAPVDFAHLRQLFHEWGEAMSNGDGWQALFWNNHDQPRALNRFIKDLAIHHQAGASMLAASIHLSRGTPYIYMGEEIGMVDPDFEQLSDYVDVESHNAYDQLLASGYKPEDAFEIIQKRSRDNSRTPMQWTADPGAGFTSSTPWLAIGKHKDYNVASQAGQAIFSIYQQLISLRKTYRIISHGEYVPAYQDHPTIYAFIRHYQGERLLVVNNFSDRVADFNLLVDFKEATILFNNLDVTPKETLSPYQSLAYYLP